MFKAFAAVVAGMSAVIAVSACIRLADIAQEGEFETRLYKSMAEKYLDEALRAQWTIDEMVGRA